VAFNLLTAGHWEQRQAIARKRDTLLQIVDQVAFRQRSCMMQSSQLRNSDVLAFQRQTAVLQATRLWNAEKPAMQQRTAAWLDTLQSKPRPVDTL
jgi:hypothetical protein